MLRLPIYRAGLPPTRGSWLDGEDIRRSGKWFVWMGPYIIGWGWDDE